MTWEFIWIIILVLGALGAFIWEKWPVDLTAMGVLGLIVGTSVVAHSPLWPSVDTVLSVFANPAALTIIGMFILSASLERCGVVADLARFLSRCGRLPYPIFLGVLVVGVTCISAFMNNTVVVVVLLPVILGLAKQYHYAPSKLLIPLSYASIFGGCCTAIGTSINLLASGLLGAAGYETFGMFDFAWIGVPMAIFGLIYFVVFGNVILPNHCVKDPSLEDGENFVNSLRPSGPFWQRAALLSIFAMVIGFAATEAYPIVGLVGVAVVLICILGLMPIKEIYGAIDGRTMMLLYGTLALGIAMDKTGFAHAVANSFAEILCQTVSADCVPYCFLGGIYIGTLILTEMLSNSATILLMGPIALELAETAEIAPHPLMMAACIAASAGFMMPTGYQTHMYVYAPGKYKFIDFLRAGWPLNVAYAAWSCFIIPIIFPFQQVGV